MKNIAFRSSTFGVAVLFGTSLLIAFPLHADSALYSRKTLLRDESTISLQAIDRKIAGQAEPISLKQYMTRHFLNDERLLVAQDDVAVCKKCSSTTELNNAPVISNAFDPITCLVNTGKGILGSFVYFYYILRAYSTILTSQCFSSIAYCIPNFFYLIFITVLAVIYLPLYIIYALFACGGPLAGIFTRTSMEVDDFNRLLSGVVNDDSFADKIKDINNSHRRTMANTNETEAIQQSLDTALFLSFGEDNMGDFIIGEIKRSLKLIADTVDETSSVVSFHDLSRSLQSSLSTKDSLLGNSTAFDALYETVMSKMESTFPGNEYQNDIHEIKGMFMGASDLKLDTNLSENAMFGVSDLFALLERSMSGGDVLDESARLLQSKEKVPGNTTCTLEEEMYCKMNTIFENINVVNGTEKVVP